MTLNEYRCAPTDRAGIVGPGFWHVLTTEPQHEGIAFAHLAARRFGVYLPEIVTTAIVRGRKRDIHHPMFPGYLFVLVFGFKAQWRRILGAPGVSGVLMSGDQAAIVPDAAMRIIQAQEDERAIQVALQDFLPKPKKRWRRRPNPQARPQADTVHIRMTTYSALQCLNSLDEKARNGALKQALGLGS